MKKRVLMVATVPSMIGQFNMSNIKILQELGYEVDVAADFTDTSFWPKDRTEKFRDELKIMNVRSFQLNFSRSIFKLNRHIQSFNEVLRLIKEQDYTFVHTHTPIVSAIVRLAAHKTGTKVIYTAHGFHFYKGAPIKNWIILYPIEKLLSRYTEVLITINKEDYNRAKKCFKVKNAKNGKIFNIGGECHDELCIYCRKGIKGIVKNERSILNIIEFRFITRKKYIYRFAS